MVEIYYNWKILLSIYYSLCNIFSIMKDFNHSNKSNYGYTKLIVSGDWRDFAKSPLKLQIGMNNIQPPTYYICH